MLDVGSFSTGNYIKFAYLSLVTSYMWIPVRKYTLLVPVPDQAYLVLSLLRAIEMILGHYDRLQHPKFAFPDNLLRRLMATHGYMQSII
jgi:hypothetical protein